MLNFVFRISSFLATSAPFLSGFFSLSSCNNRALQSQIFAYASHNMKLIFKWGFATPWIRNLSFLPHLKRDLMMASRMKLHVLNFLSFSRWEPSAWQRKRNLIGSPNQKSNLSDSDIPLGRSSHSLCDYDSKEVETSSNSICQDIWVKMYRICIFSPLSSLSLPLADKKRHGNELSR